MMLKRIALILQTQNLTVSQFADRIGVQRSALSHVLGGRNNPSLDFVTKILRTFPEIRSQWLLFGEGKMYDAMSDVRTAVEPAVTMPPEAVAAPVAEVEMPSEAVSETAEILFDARPDMLDAPEAPEAPKEAVEMPMAAELADFAPVPSTESRLVKVVFFYSDGRFEEYARR